MSFVDVLRDRNLVFWAPFHESVRRTGYTPNVATQWRVVDLIDVDANAVPQRGRSPLDVNFTGNIVYNINGAVNRLALSDFSVNEYIGNGVLRIINGDFGGVTALEATSDLQITGNITIIFRLTMVDVYPFDLGYFFMCSGLTNTELQADNFLYSARANNVTGEIIVFHEYDNGINEEHGTGVILPNDNAMHSFVFQRNTATLQWQLSLDRAAFVAVNYVNNANGGNNSVFSIGSHIAALFDIDGFYRDFMIFGDLLNLAEINTILDATPSPSSWFDYSGWNGNNGTGFVYCDIPV